MGCTAARPRDVHTTTTTNNNNNNDNDDDDNNNDNDSDILYLNHHTTGFALHFVLAISSQA